MILSVFKKHIVWVFSFIAIMQIGYYNYNGRQEFIETVTVVDKFHEGTISKYNVSVYYNVEICRNNSKCYVKNVRSSFYDKASVGDKYNWKFQVWEDYSTPYRISVYILFLLLVFLILLKGVEWVVNV